MALNNVSQKPKVFSTKPSGSGSGGISEGDILQGGVANSIVFLGDASEILTNQLTLMGIDSVSGEVYFYLIGTDTSQIFGIDNANGEYWIGDINDPSLPSVYLNNNNKTINLQALKDISLGDFIGHQNSTYFRINDSAKEIRLYTNQFQITSRQVWEVLSCGYGSTITYDTSYSSMHLAFQGSGTGASTVNLSPSLSVGTVVIISDVDNKCLANNISIDAGTGNTISWGGTASQTKTMNINGQSVTIQKVNSTKWKVISQTT